MQDRRVIHFTFCEINKTQILIRKISVLNVNFYPFPPHIIYTDKQSQAVDTFNFKPCVSERERAQISAPVTGWSENRV